MAAKHELRHKQLILWLSLINFNLALLDYLLTKYKVRKVK